jgi:aminoglycoside phosphotransferase (APT) family kinase protein
LRGRPLSQSDPAQLPYEALAAALGVFLRELHAIDVTAIPVPGLPGDIIGRLDPARLPAARDRLTQLAAAGWIDNADGYVRALEQHAPNAAAPEGPRCIVHGDLYAAHVLVGASGAMTGAIDWGDVHAGDPALDIGGAYEMLPPENVPAFRRAYGRIDERMESTARYRAIYHSAMVGQYGMKIGNGDLLRAGVDGLRFAMAGVAGV